MRAGRCAALYHPEGLFRKVSFEPVQADLYPGGCGRRLARHRKARGRELLGKLHIRLVERVYAEYVPGDRGGYLPAEKLGAKLVEVGKVDVYDRVACLHERLDELVTLPASGPAGYVYKYPVGPVVSATAGALAGHRHYPPAILACGLGQ